MTTKGAFWAAFDLFEVAQLVVRATISYLERLHIRDMDLRLRGGAGVLHVSGGQWLKHLLQTKRDRDSCVRRLDLAPAA